MIYPAYYDNNIEFGLLGMAFLSVVCMGVQVVCVCLVVIWRGGGGLVRTRLLRGQEWELFLRTNDKRSDYFDFE